MKTWRLLAAVAATAALLPAVLCQSSAIRQAKTENVILVTTDGLRWQEVFHGADPQLTNREHGGVENPEALKAAFWREDEQARREALMPFLWTYLARHGQVFGNRTRGSKVQVTNGLNFSYPGFNEILAGFPDPRIDSNAPRANPNRTVLEWLNQQPRFHDRVAAFCSWDVFAFIINRARSGVFVNAGWETLKGKGLTPREELLNQLMTGTPRLWDGSRYDAFTFYAALESVKRAKPRVFYLSFDETDDWAHEGRYDRYLQAAHRVDGYLKVLWETIQAMPQYRDKTSLVVTTDHGRGRGLTDWRHHGEKIGGAEEIWMAVAGPAIPAKGEVTNAEPLAQAQVAATVAALLGEDYCAAAPRAAKPVAAVVAH